MTNFLVLVTTLNAMSTNFPDVTEDVSDLPSSGEVTDDGGDSGEDEGGCGTGCIGGCHSLTTSVFIQAQCT